MPLTPDQRIAALGVGVVILLPAFPALWKAAQLRGDTISRWKDRVDVAYAGLTECAIEALRELQAQANQLLGGMDTFDPLLAVADPAPLAAQAASFNRLLRARGLLHARYGRQLLLADLCKYLVGAYAAGVIAAGTYYTDLQGEQWSGLAGIALVSASLFSGLLLLVGYAYIENRLSGAEIMAATKTTHPLDEV